MVSCHIAHIHKARRESRPVATPRTGGIFSAGSLCAAQRLGSHNAACLHATRAEQRPGCSDSRQCQRGRSRSTMASAPWKGDFAPVQLAHSGGARVKFPRAGITARASNPKGSRLLKDGRNATRKARVSKRLPCASGGSEHNDWRPCQRREWPGLLRHNNRQSPTVAEAMQRDFRGHRGKRGAN